MKKNEKIDRTLRALQTIIDSQYPINPDFGKRHAQKVENARHYKEELLDVVNLYSFKPSFSIVARSTFEKMISRSDYVEIEEMEFVRVATVINYPEAESRIYCWLTPINEL